MSSAATAGPPYHHHSRSVNIGGPVPSSGGNNGINFNAPGGGRPQKRIYPHINDLLTTRPEINVQAPIRRILHEGNTFASQAATHIDFGRPDVALQEYIKAYIIAVEILPRHKDYPELQGDRGEAHRAFTSLKQKINSQHEKFEKVKETIKQDNLNNGTRPLQENVPVNPATVEKGTLQMEISHSRSHSIQEMHLNGNGFDNGALYHSEMQNKEVDKGPPSAAPLKRKLPPMPPKPPALHGNSVIPSSLIPGQSHDSKPTDLASRFANLRTGPPAGKPVQDPRVRTQPIEMPKVSEYVAQSSSSSRLSMPDTNSYSYPKPLGPREMSFVSSGPPRPQKQPLETEVPTMPRAPDAIYSPARNLNTPAGIDPPRSTPRSMYSLSGRSGSVVSVNGTGPVNDVDSNPYFPAIPKPLVAKVPKRSEPDLPDSTEITAEQLTNYLRLGSNEVRILLVDIRPREQFDEGHIMAQSIICVEPVGLHKDISAQEIVEALVLSPEKEEKLFDQRNEFDLVVYYDNSSTSTIYRAQNSSDINPLDDFSKAVYEYSYSKRLKRRPVLLKGGIAAWMDLCGEQSLQTSQTVSYVKEALGKRKFVKSGPPTRRPPVTPNRRLELHKYNSRPLSEQEEQHWEAELLNTQQTGPLVDQEGEWDEATFAKTTDEFFRRFPEPSAIKESMVLPLPQQPTIKAVPPSTTMAHQSGPGYEYRSFDEMNAMFPPMPARPPLARARDTGPVATVSSRPDGRIDFSKRPQLANPSGRTGLTNFGATCYMSAMIQCLCATEMFTTYLLSGEWEKNPPPRKGNESSRPPQLMTKNLAFLFRHFFQGRYDHVVPRTLRDYVYRVSSKGMLQPENARFGGRNQQDASEFLLWLLSILDDEQNPNRTNQPRVLNEAEEAEEDRQASLITPAAAGLKWWTTFALHDTNSWVTHNMTMVQATINTCQTCCKQWYNWDRMFSLELTLQNKARQTLEGQLMKLAATELGIEVDCHFDKGHKFADRKTAFTRLPPILCFSFKRFLFSHDTGLSTKNESLVTFPPILNMDQFMAGGTDDSSLPHAMRGPFTYDCYAVCQQSGSLNSGHYWAQVKDWKKNEWYKINDQVITKSKWENTQTAHSYIAFYKRRG